MNGRTLLAIVCFCTGCGTAEPAGSGEHALEGAQQASLRDGEIVLDQRADGALLAGRVEPVPPDSDADRVVVLHVVPGAAGAIDADLEGARVTDARFVGDAVVTIGADRVLRLHRAEGQPIALDTAAYEPISVAGSRIAYVRGELPFFEVARADVATGAVESVTQGMAPAWSPALTPDGQSIVFVSSVEGSPRLYRVDGSGAPRALPPTARTPSSPAAPRFVDGTDVLVFDDELGRVWLDLDRGQVVRTGEVAR